MNGKRRFSESSRLSHKLRKTHQDKVLSFSWFALGRSYAELGLSWASRGRCWVVLFPLLAARGLLLERHATINRKSLNEQTKGYLVASIEKDRHVASKCKTSSRNGVPKSIQINKNLTLAPKVSLLLLPWIPRWPQAAKIASQGTKREAPGMQNDNLGHHN